MALSRFRMSANVNSVEEYSLGVIDAVTRWAQGVLDEDICRAPNYQEPPLASLLPRDNAKVVLHSDRTGVVYLYYSVSGSTTGLSASELTSWAQANLTANFPAWLAVTFIECMYYESGGSIRIHFTCEEATVGASGECFPSDVRTARSGQIGRGQKVIFNSSRDCNQKQAQLNSSMSPQAVRTFNKHARRIIAAIDEAAVDAQSTVDNESSYLEFLDELGGTVMAAINNLRDNPLQASRKVNSSRHPYWMDDDIGQDIPDLDDRDVWGDDIVVYPNGQPVSEVDITRALNYMYGTDRNRDETYTAAEIQRAVDYWLKKTDGYSPY